MSSGRKMQEGKYKTVDDMLDSLPEDELKITLLLQKIVLSCIPDASPKLSYNAIYYRRHKNICFIWPASILWGSKKTYAGVRFGFINGHLLQDENNYLDRGGRKQVYWKDFASVKSIDPDILQSFIIEAAIIDEQSKKKKSR